MTIKTLPLPSDQHATTTDPARDPALVLTAALGGWTDWYPGNGTAYRVHVVVVAGGPDRADRVLLINCAGTTIAIQYADPETAAYRVRTWTRKRWTDTGLNRVGDYDVWAAARPLLEAAGVARPARKDVTR